MNELLLSGTRSKQVSDAKLEFSEFSNRAWAGAETLTSSVVAPNGDECREFTASSSVFLSIADKIGEGAFTIGAYIRPSSYQAQYGNSPPTGYVFQIGSFSSGYNCLAARDGSGTSAYPKTISFGAYSDQFASIGAWRHVAGAFDPKTGDCGLFVDGVYFGKATAAMVAQMVLSLGGIGDRPGYTGSNSARYGYRGLISSVRVRKGFQTQNFNPLTW